MDFRFWRWNITWSGGSENADITKKMTELTFGGVKGSK